MTAARSWSSSVAVAVRAIASPPLGASGAKAKLTFGGGAGAAGGGGGGRRAGGRRPRARARRPAAWPPTRRPGREGGGSSALLGGGRARREAAVAAPGRPVGAHEESGVLAGEPGLGDADLDPRAGPQRVPQHANAHEARTLGRHDAAGEAPRGAARRAGHAGAGAA